ncbi:MAG: tetratricopeptide repeat protein [Bacteroidia bacterium]|nr:tetratricopeptide repeat protein [Bacteroidia bacterium]
MKLYPYLLSLLIGLSALNPAQAQKYSTSSQKAIKLYEKSAEYFKERRYDEGVEQLLKAVDIDENFVEAHYRLATTYKLFSEWSRSTPYPKDKNAKDLAKEAVYYYQRVVDLSPDNPHYKDAHFALAERYLQQGKYEEAQKYAEQFIAFPNNTGKQISYINRVLENCRFAQESMQKPWIMSCADFPAPLIPSIFSISRHLLGISNLLFYGPASATRRRRTLR